MAMCDLTGGFNPLLLCHPLLIHFSAPPEVNITLDAHSCIYNVLRLLKTTSNSHSHCGVVFQSPYLISLLVSGHADLLLFFDNLHTGKYC